MGTYTRDRREQVRHTFVQPVDLDYGGNTIRGCWSRDLGVGGVQLQFLPVPVTSVVGLQVPLPRGGATDVCYVRGRVVWRSLTATGVQFDETPASLWDYMQALERREVSQPAEPT